MSSICSAPDPVRWLTTKMLVEVYNRGAATQARHTRHMENSDPQALIFPKIHFDAMLAHLRGDLTQELCGLLAGEDRRVTRVLPVPNALRSAVAYRMDGQEFVDALVACDYEPLAIYHSHPNGPPVPSATDVAEANYPDSFYVIISFYDALPSVHAYRIEHGRVTEISVEIL